MTLAQMNKCKELLDAGWQVEPPGPVPFKPGETATFKSPEGRRVKVAADGSLVDVVEVKT